MNQISIKASLKKNYVIPCFQREYAWGEEEIEGLINSIKESKDAFCLGIVTVKRALDTRGAVYKLIDGQQRLTTLYLIAIHCDIISEPYEVRLTSEYEDLTSGNNNLVGILKKEFNNIPRKMQDGYRIIEKLIPETEKEAFREKLEKVYYYEVNLDAHTDLNHYFEVMNSRGVQLSRSDIVKSLIMNKLEDDDQKRLNRLWYKYEKMDGSDGRAQSFKQVSAKGSEYRTINEILSSRDESVSQETSEPDDREEENSILNFEFFLLYAVRIYENLDDDSPDVQGEFNLSDLVGEYEELLRDKDSAAVIEFLDFMIKVKGIYDRYIVKYDSSEETWSLNIDDADDILLIQSCLRVSYTNRRIMHWIYMTLKFFYKNRTADLALYADMMRNYIRKQVIEFLEDSKSENYRTGFATPNIVLNYLDFLIQENYDDITKQIPEAKGIKIKNFKFKFRNSIEHFMPRHNESGEDNPAWVDDFGNLALLAYRTNTRIQNENPEGKAQHFERVGLSGYSLKLQIMSKLALGPTGWTQKESDEVTRIMIRLLEEDSKKLAL